MTKCVACGQDGPIRARFCWNCGGPLYGPAADGRKVRRIVTVLFSDLVDSTGLGERIDPELLEHVLTSFYEEARRVIEQYGGTVEKFIGDAVVGVFGLPTLHEDDALRAVSAAVALRSGLGALSSELERVRNVRLDLHTAINTGEVVTSPDTAITEPTVLGDAVNVAARLQQGAGPGEILLGDGTYQLVRGAVEAEPVPALTLRGRVSPVAAWRLRAFEPSKHARVRHASAPMVGRQRELDLLSWAYERTAAERTCHVMTILGEAGIGKTRLVAELEGVVAGDAAVLHGRCRPYGDDLTYGSVAEIVRQAAGILPGDPTSIAEARLAALAADDERVVARVAQVLGLREGSSELEDTYWALHRLLEMLAARRPVVLVFEDLHHAQRPLLEFLRSVALWLRNTPVLLLCLARPEILEREGWNCGSPNEVSLQLYPLPSAEASRMVEHLLGADDLAPEAREQVVGHAGGNPLFIEELVAELTEARVLSLVDGRWVVRGDLRDLRATPRIDAVLAARLDRLGPEEHVVIERAAIVGRRFRMREVAALPPPLDEQVAAATLAGLTRKELLSTDGAVTGDDQTFRFRHALIRDAAYHTIPKERRAELHEGYVDWLDQAADGQPGAPRDETLGRHLADAYRYRVELGWKNDTRTRRLGRRAGERLVAVGHRRVIRGDTPASAIALLTRSLELLLDNDPIRRTAQLDLAQAHYEGMEWAQAFEAYERAHEAATLAGDQDRAMQAAIGRLESQAELDIEEVLLPDARQTAEQACETFERRGDTLNLAKAWRLRALVEAAVGRSVAAREAAERAISYARQSGDERSEGRSVRLHCFIVYWGPTPVDEVIRYSEEAHAWATRRATRGLEKDALNILARAAAMQGRFDEARRRIAAVQRIIGDPVEVAVGRPWITNSLAAAYVELLAGQPDTAEAILRQAQHKHPILLAMLAEALVEQGRFEEAELVTRDCEERAPDGQLDAQLKWRQFRAVACAGQGHHAEAERFARDVLHLAEKSDQTESVAGVHAIVAEVHRLAGRPGEAATSAERAATLYSEKGNSVMADRMRRLAGDLEHAISRGEISPIEDSPAPQGGG